MSGSPRTNNDPIPSPVATGQAGAFFEQHVNAVWLSLLLVRGIPPILLDSQVTKVGFQNRRLGWQTDDLIVYAKNGEDQSRKLIGQVKRKFTIGSDNEECKKAFLAFWADFKNPQFDRKLDKLCLIVLRGTNAILEHLSGLFECALASSSLEDFQRRNSTDGLLNAKSKDYASEIRKIIEADGTIVSELEFWQFLQCLAVLSFDLTSKTSQTEAWIKSLLAFTANGADHVGQATSAWNTLLALVGKGMPEARDYVLADLPQDLKSGHASIPDGDHKALLALRNHSNTILRSIRTDVDGKISLGRDSVLEEVAKNLSQSQVVVIAGASGGGKSCVAKMTAALLSKEHFVFSFRAEEFTKAHLDEALHGNGFSLTGERLAALMAAQSKKVILIESAERLLEHTVRDGFTDLVSLVKRDEGWKVIVTCRSYSLDLVTASFLTQLGVQFSVVRVPELTDGELETVAAAIPNLTIPLASTRLRKIFRNPYVLDKAAKMTWSGPGGLPENERDFRRKFWAEIVREDSVAANGFPARRERVLQELALRRAKALSMYCPCNNLDQEALEKLRNRDLVVGPEDSKSIAAPAHDVLEDWALLNWIEERFGQLEGEVKALAGEIGTFPAIRRAYRLWLSEKLELDPISADGHLKDINADTTLPAHFKDDALVSMLKSSSADGFLNRNEALLSQGRCHLLKRAMHLLRVSCKEMPDWLSGAGYLQSSVMVPTGIAWPGVLKLARNRAEVLVADSPELLLGLIVDWSNLVNISEPYPLGFDEAARIGFTILEVFDQYNQAEERRRIFSVLSKIPLGDKAAFVRLMNEEGREARGRDEFADFLLEKHESFYVARELPDELIDLTKRRLYLSDVSREDPFGHRSLDVDEFFGIVPHKQFFPASAVRGPFWSLLRFHFRKGIYFVIEFVNRACDRYAHPVDGDRLEPAVQVEITLPNGQKIKHWHNSRLWNLYRGFSVGPEVVKCALMSLEKQLLGMGKQGSKYLDDWLIFVLCNSNNSAIAGVVASVVNAYPSLCNKAALSLLSCREYIEADQHTGVFSGGFSQLNDLIPALDMGTEIYREERKDADILPHRRRYLGLTALELQTLGHGAEVQAVIDLHLSELPAKEIHDEKIKLWRLALHRMDFRNYKPKLAGQGGSAEISAGTEPDTTSHSAHIVFEAENPEPDVKAVVDEARPKLDASQRKLEVFNWAWSCFSGEGKADPLQWKIFLDEVNRSDADASFEEESLPWENSPTLVAVVCARDHWQELNPEQREWCFHSIELALIANRDSDNDLVRAARYPMSPDRGAALVVSKILSLDEGGKYRDRAIKALGDGLFHASEEVARYAVEGVGQFLWTKDSDIAIQAIRALCKQAVDLDIEYERVARQPWHKRESFEAVHCRVEANIREMWNSQNAFSQDEISRVDFSKPFGAEALKLVLPIVEYSSGETEPGEILERVARQIKKWAEAKDSRDGRVPHEIAGSCVEKLANFVLRQSHGNAIQYCAPILDMMKKPYRESADFLRRLALSVDRAPQFKETFWKIWSEFADRVVTASWAKRLDSDHFYGEEILSAIFLNRNWKPGAKTWIVQEGFEGRVGSLFERLPPSWRVIEDYALYLNYIGDMTLPGAFNTLAQKLRLAPDGLNGHNTVFCLEQALQRYVYGSPQKLKRNPEIRQAVIYILDQLVEKGSSAAFKMRDDFVTPLND